MLAELRRGLVVRLRDPAVRLGLVGGVGLSLVILAGYVLLPAPTSTGGEPLRRSVEAGVLFFDRPMWHHAVLVLVPAVVCGALTTWFVRHRRVDFERSDELRMLAVQALCPPVVVTVFAVLVPLAWSVSLLVYPEAETGVFDALGFFLLALLFAAFFLGFVLPVLVGIVLVGVLGGYALIEVLDRAAVRASR